MKKNLITTDFYQISMVAAYILCDIAEEITGFESFYRHPKEEIGHVYYFKGEKEINSFINNLKEDLKDKSFINTFIKLVKDKFPKDKQELYCTKIRTFFENCNTDFQYTVFKDDAVLLPLVPAFQFKGPKWIGQLIETPITNTINGLTGLNTQLHLGRATPEMIAIVNGDKKSIYWDIYKTKLIDRALQYVSVTDKPIMDASFRRAAGYEISLVASKIALDYGFKGTSHVGAFFTYNFDSSFIGGTMAHAFIMSFPTELEAFIAWNSIFPNSVMLVDTYDTLNAIQLLIDNNIKPHTVRIDSGDFFVITFQVRKLLDEAGWTDVQIYLSGDITPEILCDMEIKKVPFDKVMVGTKYVNIDLGVNCGFVYKIVEFTSKGKRILPEKKAEGKSNYPGLKNVSVQEGTLIMDVSSETFGLSNLNLITESMPIKFIKG